MSSGDPDGHTGMTSVRSADGTPIAYSTQGSGPPLVMVHPAGAYRGFGPQESLVPMLAGDFTVVTYDRRGRGGSGDTPPYAVGREVEDLAAVVAGPGGGEASVYGFSSGALVALHAAGAGDLPLSRLAVMEPPLGDGSPDPLTAELDELVAEGRREEAVLRFHEAIGVPDEVMAAMGPESLAAMAAIAHTFVYDCRLGEASTLDTARAVEVPTLVIDSQGSTDDLTGWAAGLAAVLPKGTHTSLAGDWHGVLDADLAAALRDFLLPR
jgi:pimeloyl-ACP methyl ester carboxylesterase